VKALYWTAVINGLLAPFLLVAILVIAWDKKLMQGQPFDLNILSASWTPNNGYLRTMPKINWEKGDGLRSRHPMPEKRAPDCARYLRTMPKINWEKGDGLRSRHPMPEKRAPDCAR
jgi:Mn2+/Fe2+ NRAMP family transporter